MSTEPTTAALPGFGPLFEKELLEARRSKRLIAFVVVMTIILLLIPLLTYQNAGNYGTGSRHLLSPGDVENMLGTWSAIVGFLGSLMIIASTVDAITHERALGVTAWIITKPVSRLSYLLAKATAHAVIACVTVVLIPSMIWLVFTLLFFQDISVINILAATGILCIEMAFLSFAVLSIGVFFRSVAPIAIISLALWFLPNVVPAVERLRWTYRVLPSYLPIAALSAAIDQADGPTITIPLASLAIAAVAFAVAVVYFERQEL
jgi:ABC-2 type transport system permease protein